MFGARIGLAPLAQFCHRLAQSLGAGIDLRRVLAREAEGRGTGAFRRRMQTVADHVAAGGTLAQGFRETGAYFPSLFRELVEVGEQTGNLTEVLHQLADHYDHQLSIRRTFTMALILPAIQLFAALVIVGLVILVMGFLPHRHGQPIDILGFGLTGMRGLAIYAGILLAVFGSLALLVRTVLRGGFWLRPLQKLLLRVPVWGGFLQLLALSRLAWTLHLTTNTSLALDRALPLCLRATQNAAYYDHAEQIVDGACRGRELHEVFAEARAFPPDFLDALEVGERTGQIPETMSRLAEQYREEAQRRVRMLVIAGGFAAGLVVLMLIVAMIVQIFRTTISPYFDTINELTQPGAF